MPLAADCECHGSGFSASGLGPAFVGAAKPLTGHSLCCVSQQSAVVPPFLFFRTLSLLLTGILVEGGRERRACLLFQTLVAGSPLVLTENTGRDESFGGRHHCDAETVRWIMQSGASRWRKETGVWQAAGSSHS